MKGVVPPDLVDKKISEALLALKPGLPATPMARLVESALLVARGRIKHLEQRLGETETMRDRIAMQLLPGIQERTAALDAAAGRLTQTADLIRLAYHQADKVLEIRVQGSAGAPGETTSSKFQEYVIGDKLKLRGKTATITDAELDDEGVWRYDWSFQGGGSEGRFSAVEIAEIRARA